MGYRNWLAGGAGRFRQEATTGAFMPSVPLPDYAVSESVL